jgi:hypothetical protein
MPRKDWGSMDAKMALVKIDREFEALIPKLSSEEYSQLRLNVSRDGCRDNLRVWFGHNILLDGHNRYRICQETGKDFGVTPIELPDREAALLWIEENQLGRRNLSDAQRAVIVKSIERRRASTPEARKAQTEAATTAKKLGKTVDDTVSSTEKTKRSKGNNSELAKKHNIPERQLRYAGEIEAAAENAAEGSPIKELPAKVRAGEIDLLEARREIRKGRPSVEIPTKYRDVVAALNRPSPGDPKNAFHLTLNSVFRFVSWLIDEPIVAAIRSYVEQDAAAFDHAEGSLIEMGRRIEATLAHVRDARSKGTSAPEEWTTPEINITGTAVN